MLLDMQTIIDETGKIPFNGIIHIGAGQGEEIEIYSNASLRHALWVEANPELMRPLYENTRFHSIRSQYLNAVLSDINNQETILNVSNKFEYSSLLKMDALRYIDSSVQINKKLPILTKRFESLYREHNTEIDLSKFDLIRVSTNGTELDVLKGFGKLYNIFSFRVIIVSFNDENLFESACNVEDIDQFLNTQGFTKILTMSSDNLRKEAVYKK